MDMGITPVFVLRTQMYKAVCLEVELLDSVVALLKFFFLEEM